MSKSLTTPVEIDTEIARLLMAEEKPVRTIQLQERYRDSDSAYTRHSFSQEKFDAALAELRELRVQRLAVEALYTNWPRYYHVTNVNGHIHTSTHCSSCFPDTQFAWRTDLSGLSEQEVVDREAYNACTVCMPIAPAEQKAAREYYNRQQREARAAERQAKADAKEAKAHARAVKIVDKVQKAIRDLTGEGEDFEAIQVFKNEFSDHGKDGKRSLYGLSWEDEHKHLKITSTIEDILMYIVTDDRWNKPNAAVINELKNRNMI